VTVTIAGTVEVGLQASTVTVTVSSALEVETAAMVGVGVGELVVRTPAAAAAEVGVTVARVVGTADASLILVSMKSAPGAEVVVATGASDVVGLMTIGVSDVVGMAIAAADVEAVANGASEVLTTAGVVDSGVDLEVVEETTAAAVDATVPEEPKLLDAVVDAPLLTSTSFTMTTSPFTLVILTSTVVVPVPLDISKKLYVWRVVASQVLPSSAVTSTLATAWLPLTTCIENQYADTPSFRWTERAEVIGHST